MNVAGRKIVGSTCTPASAGARSRSAASTSSRDLKRVGAELLLDDQQQAGHVVDDRVADRRRGTLDDRGDVADAEGRAVALGDDDRFEIAGRADRRRVRDRETLVRRIEEPAGLQRDAFTRGPHHVVDREVVGAQPIGIDQHLQLAIALPPDRDVRHTRNRHQARPHRPLRQRRQLDLRELLRRDADLHHAAQRRERREHHRRPGDRRQLRRDTRQALLYHCLAASTSVPGSRTSTTDESPRTDFDRMRVEAGDAVERGLERDRHQRFHFRCRETGRLGLHFDQRRRELREHVERRRAQRAPRDHHGDHRERHDDDPVAQRQRDEPGHHVSGLLRIQCRTARRPRRSRRECQARSRERRPPGCRRVWRCRSGVARRCRCRDLRRPMCRR